MTRARFVVVSMVACLTVASWTCSSGPRTREIRTYSEHFVFRITSDPMPPRARETIPYKIVVQDKDTRQPIEVGRASCRERVFITV